jgi:putative addiction module component (TIGR02574 family)
MTKDQFINEAMTLNPSERDEVAEALWHSIAPSDLTPEQTAELKRRIDAIDRGEAQFIPGEEVMRELRQRFQR